MDPLVRTLPPPHYLRFLNFVMRKQRVNLKACRFKCTVRIRYGGDRTHTRSMVNYVKDPQNRTIEESAWCGVPFDMPDLSCQLLMLLSTGIFFVAPMTLILILYVRIALVLHRSSRNGSLRRCCATQHQPNYNNGMLNGSAAGAASTANNPYLTNNSGKRCQTEKTHIQSRRAVIRMLGVSSLRIFTPSPTTHFLYGIREYGKLCSILNAKKMILINSNRSGSTVRPL
ncbi:unnamed protein product [Allacma fusca]|uniref:Uncharacterized protein n=1 Tax=Allacma fusca TaxID=39272 RepID=A0A8J2J257_9HEXA|nr:unnamed protein product [Allacma fusca]